MKVCVYLTCVDSIHICTHIKHVCHGVCSLAFFFFISSFYPPIYMQLSRKSSVAGPIAEEVAAIAAVTKYISNPNATRRPKMKVIMETCIICLA